MEKGQKNNTDFEALIRWQVYRNKGNAHFEYFTYFKKWTKHGQKCTHNYNRKTVLSILNAEEEQIDQITLPVQKWTQQFSSLEFPMCKGVLKAKVRRRQMMQIRNPSSLSLYATSDVQEQSQEFIEEEINIKMMRSQTLTKNSRVQIDTFRDELARIKKQLQDSLYVNNKLKNDRSVLLSKNHQLESEVGYLRKQIREDIENIEKYYIGKIELRQNIYEDEINTMINTFNSNSDYNSTMIKVITDQSLQIQQENKKLKHQIQGMAKQLEEYDEKMFEIEKEKQQLRHEIKKMGENIERINLQKNEYFKMMGQLELTLEERKKQLQQCWEKIKWQQANKQLEKQERILMVNEVENSKLAQRSLNQRLSQLQQQLQTSKYQLQFSDQTYKKLKEESDTKQQMYRTHIIKLEEVIKDYEQGNLKNNSQILQQQQNLREIDNLKKQIVGVRGSLEEANSQIESLMKKLSEEMETQETRIKYLSEQKQKIQKVQIQQSLSNSTIFKQKQDMIGEQQMTIINLKSQIEIITGDVKLLKQENLRLKEEKQFINDNAIKVEEHEELQNTITQLQNRLAQYQNNESSNSQQNNVDTPSKMKSQKQKISFNVDDLARNRKTSILSMKDKNENNLKEKTKNMTYQERIQFLEQELKFSSARLENLQFENNDLKTQQSLLTVQMAQIYAREKELKKKLETTQMKVVEYCSSEQQENRMLDEQFEEMGDEEKKFFTSQQLQPKQSHKHQHRRVSISKQISSSANIKNEPMNGGHRVKKCSSLQQDPIKNKKKHQIKSVDEQCIQENHNQSSGHQQTEKSIGNFKPTFNPIVYRYTIDEQKEQFDDAIEEKRGKQPRKNNQIRSQIMKKSSQVNAELGDSVYEARSNKSKSNVSNMSNSQGRQSYVSGSTLYKFQKISHREKIKKLQAQIQQNKVLFEQYMHREEELIGQMQKYKNVCESYQKEIKNIEEDRHSLKASLHFELEKRNFVRNNAVVQTEKLVCFSKQTEANIILEDPEKQQFQMQAQKFLKLNKVLQNELKLKQKQIEGKEKIFETKIQESEKRQEETNKKMGEKESQISKFKKEMKALEDKENESRVCYQTLKFEKTQLEYAIERVQSENKRSKVRIEELEEKIKKNDVSDQLRQVQFDFDGSSKKIIQLNRHIYQLKLEKDTFEDETKIAKKKASDSSRKASQLEDQIERLQKSIDEQKRKEAKQRRQFQDKEQVIQKQKVQIQRMNQQVTSLKNQSNEQNFEKKKIMEEINKVQNLNERKQYELINSKKQLDKLKYRLIEKDEEQNGHKTSLNKQMSRLQFELSNRNKQIVELQVTVKQLTNKLQLSSNENKKSIHEKVSVYSEKLKIYVEEIAEIKKLLDENTVENGSLKYRINECLEEIQGLKINCNRMEQRCEQEASQKNQIIEVWQNQKNENDKMKFKLQEMETEVDGFRVALKQLKGELEREKKENETRKSEIESLRKTNENYFDQINKNKVKLSDYETELQINKNYNEKLSQTNKELRSLTKQLRESKTCYEEYKSKYVYTISEYESSLKTCETKWKQKLETTFISLNHQQENKLLAIRKKHETEVIDLLNEMARLKTQTQIKQEEISHLSIKLSKLQFLPLKIDEMEKIYQQKQNEISRYRAVEQQNLALSQKLHKLEESLQKVNCNKNELSSDLLEVKAQKKQTEEYLNEYEQMCKKLQQQNLSLKTINNQMLQTEGQLKSEIQKLVHLNKSIEDDKNSILKKMEENRKQYNEKIRTLQQKLDLMGATVGEHEQALSLHYEKNIDDIKSELQRMYQEMQNKDLLITELEELQGKNEFDMETLQKQIIILKSKQASDEEMFQAQFTKLKNKMFQNQTVSKQTINSLEVELEELGRELASLKIMSTTNPNHSSSVSESNNEIVRKRFEQKCKQKDEKIEELKQNIYILEETVIKMKKKQSQNGQLLLKIQKAQQYNSELLTENRIIKDENKRIQQKEGSLNQSTKSEIIALKTGNQKLKLIIEEKDMQIQSLKYDYKTTKQLYGELQRELQKRKNIFKEKTENEQNFNEQMYKKQEQISQLEQTKQEERAKCLLLMEQVQKKVKQINVLQQKISVYEKNENKLKSTKTNTQSIHYKNQIKRLSEELQSLQKNYRKVKQENQVLQKQNDENKTKISLNQNSILSLNSSIEELSIKCKDLQNDSRKYQGVNELCYQQFHVSLQEAFLDKLISQRIQEKQNQINNLMEEVEELKFLNERKLMDNDELKRYNYQLQLKFQDAEFASEQVNDLRQICDKLQQEKKQVLFREEILKVQVQKLLEKSPNEVKERLDRLNLEQMMRKISYQTNSPLRLSFS